MSRYRADVDSLLYTERYHDYSLPSGGIDEGEDEVIAEVDKGKRTYKISGVPFFLIEAAAADARPYSLSGAQNKETFLELFQELDEV